jgi:hypothetical protein
MEALSIALVAIFVLYLVDKNKAWKPVLKFVGGAAVLVLLVWGSLVGWDSYTQWRKAQPPPPAQPLAQSQIGGAGSTVDIHGGENLKVIRADTFTPSAPKTVIDYDALAKQAGSVGSTRTDNPEWKPVPGSDVPLVYLGHNQKFIFACGDYGEKQVPDAWPKKENGQLVCP